MFNEEDSFDVFNELEASVYSKACDVSWNIISESNGFSSGNHSNQPFKTGKGFDNFGNGINNFQNSPIPSSAFYNSTPKSKSLSIKTFDVPLRSHQMLSKKTSNKMSIIPAPDGGHFDENSFTPQKLLELYDKQRCLTVEKVMSERIQNMHETDKLIHDNLKQKWQAEQEEAIAKRLFLEQYILDKIHEEAMTNRPKREVQLAEENMKNAHRVLQRIQKVKDAENEARKKSEALSLLQKENKKALDAQKENEVREKVLNNQKNYCEFYENMLYMVNSYSNKELLNEKHSNVMRDLKNLSVEYENLCNRNKTNKFTEEDLTSFEKLVETSKDVNKNLVKAIEAVNAEVEKANNAKVEKVKEDEPVKPTPNENSAEPGLSDCFDSQSVHTYLHLKTYSEEFENSCKALMEDDLMKKFRFNCQKAVTMPVNAISPMSSAHLSDKYFKLHSLLSGKMVDIGGDQVRAMQHPEGISYCKKLLAKKFVRQGDLTVSSKPDAAFAIAAVLTSLWVDFPDFGQLTLAYFQKSCPYLAPVFMPQLEGESDMDYYKSLGYHYSENGEVEKQDSFLKRMGGIMRLYAAVIISKVRQPDKQNPLGIAEGWRWISALLNLEPRPDICSTLLHVFLEVAGSEMFKVYGTQFKKLLAYICQEYYPRLEKVVEKLENYLNYQSENLKFRITPASSGGPMVRLEQFLQKVMKDGSIPPPKGLLPHNFW